MRDVPRKARQPAKHRDLKKLGERVRHLRQQRNMSQEALEPVMKFRLRLRQWRAAT